MTDSRWGELTIVLLVAFPPLFEDSLAHGVSADSELAREGGCMETQDMTDDDYTRKLNAPEMVDRVLNDPDVRMQPALIWRLLAEISKHDLQSGIIASQRFPRPSLPKSGR